MLPEDGSSSKFLQSLFSYLLVNIFYVPLQYNSIITQLFHFGFHFGLDSTGLTSQPFLEQLQHWLTGVDIQHLRT